MDPREDNDIGLSVPEDLTHGEEKIKVVTSGEFDRWNERIKGLDFPGDFAHGKEKTKDLDFPGDFARGKERIKVEINMPGKLNLREAGDKGS